MSLTHKIAEGTAQITLSNVVTIIFNLLSFIIIVRILSRYEYGLIVLTLSAVSILTTLLDPGIRGIIIADVSRERSENRYDRAKTLLYRYIQIEIILSLTLFAVLFSSNIYFEQKYSRVVGELVKISAFLIIANAGKNIFLTFFNSHLDFKSFLYLNAGESFFKLLYVVLFGYYFKFGLYGVMLAYPLSVVTSLILTFHRFINITKGYLCIPRSKESFFLNTMKSHGKWAVGIFTLKNLSSNIPPWIIQFFLGVEAVAIFNVARRPVAYVNSLLSPLESVLMPIISREIRNIKRINKIVNRGIKYSLWISLPVVLFGIIFSPKIFNLLFGNFYMESAKIFQLLILVSMFYAINLTFRPIFFGFKAQKFLFTVYIISITIFIVLGTILTYLIGLYGMVLAFILNGFITFLLRYRYAKKMWIIIKFREIIRIDDYDKELILKIIKTTINKLKKLAYLLVR